MFRLPTHLETFIPPPRDQLPQGRPWRGKLVILNPSQPQIVPHQEIFCTAAETEGDNEVFLWPPVLHITLLNQRPILPELQAWIKRESPPMCMFMPDRLSDVGSHGRNQGFFESLARTLHDGQIAAIAQWAPPDRPSAAGIIVFPTSSSRALLVGAVLLNTGLPEFLTHDTSISLTRAHVASVPRHVPYSIGDSPYDPAPPNIASSQRRGQSTSNDESDN
ncbi:hypothetical protein NLI96_g7287 [Meripilus lineatus]|uniref:Uncharacterized protein n=1 Tax=Meripilus lineatus TaxID=2056292 RepID=A0AAD5YF61_9APHY|nr:hypothetical protein NLI96_g7287 [Physisporinus lineatus]